MSSKETKKLPRHIAIIMDGNGRWAKRRMFKRIRGHEKGADTVREIVTASRELGIEALSLYAFSEENWNRPKLEVEALMHLLRKYLVEERSEIMDNDIRLTASGRIKQLPDSVLDKLLPLIEDSAANNGMILNLCLAYGGKQELVDAMRKIVSRVVSGELAIDEIDEKQIDESLYVPELPPVDLMIRTSGEMRSSGFLPWQIAYAEFHFIEKYWPDFSKADLYEAIDIYRNRERRFGHTSEQLKNKQ